MAFALANYRDQDEVLTRDGFAQGTLFNAHAKNHKSPGVSMARMYEEATDTYSNVFDFEMLDPLGERSVFRKKEEDDGGGRFKR